jgi:glycosyltransferase involved in cell wall biosynthesis
VEVKVIHWPVNKEAPFKFDFPNGAQFIEKNNLSGQKLSDEIKAFNPDFIYCSGWMDKDYLNAIKGYKNSIPVVIGLDTHWEGKLKQRIACLISSFTLLKIFSHCWVPGNKQKQYALKLGFEEDKIMTGYYAANVDYFKSIGDSCIAEKKKKYPHKLIYAGRYYDFKGITDVWEAFISWKKETNNDWELWCLGTGDIKPIEHPAVKHFGFVQPKDIGPYILGTGIFVMPSRFEPWGVVLHEFCAAGLPVICSDKVGAVEAFVKDCDNGYIYPAGNINELKERIKKITALPDDKLFTMGEVSKKLALGITPAKWADTLINIIQKNK